MGQTGKSVLNLDYWLAWRREPLCPQNVVFLNPVLNVDDRGCARSERFQAWVKQCWEEEKGTRKGEMLERAGVHIGRF
jgi:hypothetical protein